MEMKRRMLIKGLTGLSIGAILSGLQGQGISFAHSAPTGVAYVDEFLHLSVGSDNSPAIYAAINSLPQRGGDLIFGPQRYYVPNGIVESKRGLQVIGTGHGYIGPGGTSSPTGTLLDSDGAGIWTWIHRNTNTQSNSNYGISFRNMTFSGSGSMAGGVWTQTNHNTLDKCYFVGYTGSNAVGLQAGVIPGGIPDDASWNVWTNCIALDCMIGARALLPNSGGECTNFVTLHTLARGLRGMGIGLDIHSSNWSILGGKDERNEVGTYIHSGNGVTIQGRRSEQNGTGFKLDRPISVSHASRIILSGCQATGASNLIPWYVGANNIEDRIIGFSEWIGNPVDLGTGTQVS